ncbi:MAG: three component ABC system middle component [Shewanella oncorhynchi]
MNPHVIRDIKYSPAFVSEILHSFIDGSKKIEPRGAKFELIYLVIPFLMDDELRKKLCSSKITSTFKTAFLIDKRLKEKLFFIDSKVKYSKNITNDGLIYLGSSNELSVGQYIMVYDGFSTDKTVTDYKREFHKASYNLGTIFAKEGYVNVFLKTKVKNI